MPTLTLDAAQLRAALTLLPDEVRRGSPLRPLTTAQVRVEKQTLRSLVEQQLVRKSGQGWKLNQALAGVLRACADPEEVLGFRADRAGAGFTVVRRGPVLVECTVDPAGWLKLEFPLTRTALLATLMAALREDEPVTAGPDWELELTATEALMVATAQQLTREAGEPPTSTQLLERTGQAAPRPAFAGPFALLGGLAPLGRLASSQETREEALDRLLAAGVLQLQDHQLALVGPASEVFGRPPGRGFTVTRKDFGGDGDLTTHTLRFLSCSGHPVVSWIEHRGTPTLCWRLASGTEVRALLLELLLTPDERALWERSSPRPDGSLGDPGRQGVEVIRPTGAERSPAPRRPGSGSPRSGRRRRSLATLLLLLLCLAGLMAGSLWLLGSWNGEESAASGDAERSAASGEAEPEPPAGAESPEACFHAVEKSLREEDWRALFRLLLPESREQLVERYYFVTIREDRYTATEPGVAIAAILERHRIEVSYSDPAREAIDWESTLDRLARAGDRVALFEDLYRYALELGAAPLRPSDLPVRQVSIEGERATVEIGEGGGGAEFVRVDGRWYLSLR